MRAKKFPTSIFLQSNTKTVKAEESTLPNFVWNSGRKTENLEIVNSSTDCYKRVYCF